MESYRPTHNQNHHQFTQLETDHLCTDQMQYSWHLLNLLLFFPHVSTHAPAALASTSIATGTLSPLTTHHVNRPGVPWHPEAGAEMDQVRPVTSLPRRVGSEAHT